MDTNPAQRTDARHRRASGPRLVSVDQGYELWAPTYDLEPNPLLALEERTLGSLLPSLTGKNALDVACGTGRWLEKLLKSGARWAAGCDLSPAMLAVARGKPGLRPRLVRADCTALPFCSGVSGFVMCSFALGHVPDVQRLARELARVARPGADCYVSDVHPAAYARGWRPGFRHAGGAAEITSFARSVDELHEAFALQGFKLRQLLEPRLGEPERLAFAQTGRERLFEEAATVPAVLICHFTRLGPGIEAR
jgi:ubiquinone/menaquinone biosynthesis C-methylase UbiE